MITQAQCTCGTKIEIRRGTDVTFTMRADKMQAMYSEDIGHYSIYRCKSCLKPLHQTVREYEYIPYVEKPPPVEQGRKRR